MNEQLSNAVASAAKAYGVTGRPSVQQAKAIVEAWLKAQDLRPDRWGNYVYRDGSRRFNFGKTALRHQKKEGDRWVSISSGGVIDAAVDLLTQAASGPAPSPAAAGLADTVQRAKAASQSSAERKKLEQIRAQAEVLAFKRTEAEYRQDIYRNLIAGKRLPEQRAAEINEALARYKLEMVRLLQTQGFTPPGDEAFVDADRPPLLPVVSASSKYCWVESVSDVTYSIHVSGTGKGGARIEIGNAGSMAVDPRTMRAVYSQPGAQGDSYISGYVQRVESTLIGVLFLVISKQKRSGAGSRAMSIWCRIMRGYGIDPWVAEAVGDQGEAFLQAMQSRGVLRLGRRFGSANIEVSCA